MPQPESDDRPGLIRRLLLRGIARPATAAERTWVRHDVVTTSDAVYGGSEMLLFLTPSALVFATIEYFQHRGTGPDGFPQVLFKTYVVCLVLGLLLSIPAGRARRHRLQQEFDHREIKEDLERLKNRLAENMAPARDRDPRERARQMAETIREAQALDQRLRGGRAAPASRPLRPDLEELRARIMAAETEEERRAALAALHIWTEHERELRAGRYRRR